MTREELKKLIKDYLESHTNQNPSDGDVDYLFENLSVFRKEIEFQNEELKRINVELEKKNSFIETIFRIIPSIIVLIDDQFNVVKGNREFYNTFGHYESKNDDFRRLFADESQSDLYFLLSKRVQRTNLIGINNRSYIADLSDTEFNDKKYILLHLTDVTEIEQNKRRISVENALKKLANDLYFNNTFEPFASFMYSQMVQKLVNTIQEILVINKMYFYEWTEEDGVLKISSDNGFDDGLYINHLDQTVAEVFNIFNKKKEITGSLLEKFDVLANILRPHGLVLNKILLNNENILNRILLTVSTKEIDEQTIRTVGDEVSNLLEKVKNKITLAENERRLKTIIENSPDGLAVIENGKLLFASDNYFKITGVSRHDDRWKDLPNIFEYIHHDDRKTVRNTLLNALKNKEKTIMYEFRILNSKGEYIWQQDKINILYFGEEGYRLYITARNITEQKKQIERLLILEAAINQTDASIMITDAEGHIRFVNTAFTQITGYTQDEVLNQNPRILKSGLVAPETYEELWKNLISGKSWHGELINKKKDGSLFTESVTISPVVIQEKITNFVAVKKDITKLKELQKKYETLSLVASHTQNMVIITDNKGYITWVNKSFEQKTGYTFQEVLGKKPGAILQGKDTSTAHVTIIRKKLKELVPFKQEILNYTKLGEPYWIEMTVTPIFDNQGNHTMYIAVEDDITIRKDFERKIINSERKNRAIISALPDLLLVIDKDFRIIEQHSHNPSILFNDQLIYLGKTIDEVLTEKDRKIFKKNIVDVFSTAEFREFILQQDINGDKRYFECRCVLKDVKSVLVLVRDITKTKTYELQLNNEKILFKTVIDNLPNTIYVKDKNFKKILVNKAEVYYLGKTSETEVLGKSDDEFYEADVLAGIQREDNEVMAGKPLINKVIEYTNIFGDKKYMMISKLPFKDVYGDIAGIIGIGVDITSLKLKEDELRKTISIITDQNERLRSFTYIISHNIRSYAANIQGLIDLINNQMVSENEKPEIFKLLQKASDNLMETITSLNTIITIEKSVKNTLEKVHINKVLTKVLSIVNKDIQENQILIINDISDAATVVCNPSYLESILLNFTTNAIRYRNKNVRSFIKYSYYIKDAYKVIEISDNGLGIDLEKYGKKLFNMFETFHGNPEAKGLGLFITRAQVESMGGKIEVKSKVNEGTTFSVLLKK